MTGKPGQDRLKHDGQNSTGRTGKAGRIGQEEQDRLNRAGRKGQAEQDRQAE
jgi:hypothetical protein